MPSEERRPNWKSRLYRTGAVIAIGASALTLSACHDKHNETENTRGTIVETRTALAKTAFVRCLNNTPYSIYGPGAEWSHELYGKYYEGKTNAVITITPESGGETLLLEQKLTSDIRPWKLAASPLTNMEILDDIDCSPTDLPGDPGEHTVTYIVEDNTKLLKHHGLIK